MAYKAKEPREELFYIFVLLSPLVDGPEMRRNPDRFFILNQAEAGECEASYMRTNPNYNGIMRGFPFNLALPHEDKWDKLPH